MHASLYRNHLVVVGVGKVGYRIVKELVATGELVVAVERQEDTELLDEVRGLGVPVIPGNGRLKKTLELAGVPRARSVILATDDDLTNLDAALTARELNPDVRVVLRLFDDTLADKFASKFAMPAISISHVAAPAFIAAATGRKVYHGFQLDGAQLHLTDLTVTAHGALAGQTVGDVQARHGVNIVMHRGPEGVTINPAHGAVLAPADTVLVMAPQQRLVELEAANNR